MEPGAERPVGSSIRVSECMKCIGSAGAWKLAPACRNLHACMVWCEGRTFFVRTMTVHVRKSGMNNRISNRKSNRTSNRIHRANHLSCSRVSVQIRQSHIPLSCATQAPRTDALDERTGACQSLATTITCSPVLSLCGVSICLISEREALMKLKRIHRDRTEATATFWQ